jgi:hypothetical protein
MSSKAPDIPQAEKHQGSTDRLAQDVDSKSCEAGAAVLEIALFCILFLTLTNPAARGFLVGGRCSRCAASSSCCCASARCGIQSAVSLLSFSRSLKHCDFITMLSSFIPLTNATALLLSRVCAGCPIRCWASRALQESGPLYDQHPHFQGQLFWLQPPRGQRPMYQ